LLTETAQRGGSEPITDPDDLSASPEGPAKQAWYDQKGFFEHKLAEPNIWTRARTNPKRKAANAEPAPHQGTDSRAHHFLLAARKTLFPQAYQYRPLITAATFKKLVAGQEI